MTKGGLKVKDILKLQKLIVPELVEVLEKRYNVLRTIYHNQPIGRRVLANQLNLGERVVRNEINFLKAQNLIDINTPGMTITEEGQKVVNELKEFIHEIKGLFDVEIAVKNLLGLKGVVIVPGNVEENQAVLKDLGKATATYIKSIIKKDNIVAVTGGTTIRAVVEEFPQLTKKSDVLVVPARGGMGKKVESQANNLAALLAKKLNGSYRMLHIPENISSEVLDSLLKEHDIKEIVEYIHKADILIYGIGNAIEMAEKRNVSEEQVQKLLDLKAVGEAFGCYFNKNSEVVLENTSIGIKTQYAKKINTHIAVAAGENKVESIISAARHNSNVVLFTDEAAGRKIIEYFSNQTS